MDRRAKDPLNISVITQIPPSKCWNCGKENDSSSGPDLPEKDDVCLCMYCGVVSFFNADLTLREPTVDELVAANDDVIVRIFKKSLEMLHANHPDAFPKSEHRE